MKGFVAVTDNDWYRFLSCQPDIDEVNFWQPKGTTSFKALEPGQPFLFKLHSPLNFIVGGGFFAHFSLLPSMLAWEAFGVKNGASSYGEMRRQIEKYRRGEVSSRGDYTIGCILLSDPFFFERADWIPAPADFAPNIVKKGYDLGSGIGRELWEEVQARLRIMRSVGSLAEPETVYGDPVLVRQRLGQGTFRILVTDVYQKRCAVTGERVLPVLQAAHIRPVSEGGKHRIDNGLLLRSDVHTLFDRGYVTVTPDLRVRVSRQLRDDFDNGEHYFQLQNHELWTPSSESDRPNREFLEWHGDTVFLR